MVAVMAWQRVGAARSFFDFFRVTSLVAIYRKGKTRRPESHPPVVICPLYIFFTFSKVRPSPQDMKRCKIFLKIFMADVYNTVQLELPTSTGLHSR